MFCQQQKENSMEGRTTTRSVCFYCLTTIDFISIAAVAAANRRENPLNKSIFTFDNCVRYGTVILRCSISISFAFDVLPLHFLLNGKQRRSLLSWQKTVLFNNYSQPPFGFTISLFLNHVPIVTMLLYVALLLGC